MRAKPATVYNCKITKKVDADYSHYGYLVSIASIPRHRNGEATVQHTAHRNFEYAKKWVCEQLGRQRIKWEKTVIRGATVWRGTVIIKESE